MSTRDLGPSDGVYLIGAPHQSQPGEDATPQTMGFKAFNLLRMANAGLNVPPALVLGTQWCANKGAPETVWRAALGRLESICGLRLGDARHPLFLSVRSGAPVSMPGMMETLLNIGVCDATLGGLLGATGNPRLVWDAYRRLVATYGEVVDQIPAQSFDEILQSVCGGRSDRDLDFAELREVTRRSLDLYAKLCGRPFPQDPSQQLSGAISAVFHSWQSEKARAYREMHRIDESIGTAVTIQQMVFGNAGGQSGAGVGFTRDPVSGDRRLWVDFLFNAQGEDVVSGRRSAHGHEELATVMPDVWHQLQTNVGILERTFGDMQDIEFTVQDGRLFMLQTRNGKRSPIAAVRIAFDMKTEGLIAGDLAKERVDGISVEKLVRTELVADTGQCAQVLARGSSANGGVATGRIALNEAQAASFANAGDQVILVRRDAETGDLSALAHADALVTQHGARTSHAAVVARQMAKVCVVGCEDLLVDESSQSVTVGDVVLAPGDLLTIDGNAGDIYQGVVKSEAVCPPDVAMQLALLQAG